MGPLSSIANSMGGASPLNAFRNIASEFSGPFRGQSDPVPPLPPEVAQDGAKYMPLALGAYGDDSSVGKEWREISSEEFGSPLNAPMSGMQSKLYENRDSGEVVLSYRGTDLGNGLADIGADIEGIAGGVPQGAFDALRVAENAKARYGDRLSITGHSLGGGYAMAAGLATGTPTVTFDAPGFGQAGRNVIGEDNIARNSHLITNLNGQGNFVSDLDRNNDSQTLGGDQIGQSYFYNTDGADLFPLLRNLAPVDGLVSHLPHLQNEELQRQATGQPDRTNDVQDTIPFALSYLSNSLSA